MSIWLIKENPGLYPEAFADWLGIAVKLREDPNAPWTIAEKVIPIRSLSNPTLYGHPENYRGQNWVASEISDGCVEPDICVNDYCGVHSNSGVANKMFYLLSLGGSQNDISVEGIGVNNAMKIAVEAARNYWTTNTNFLMAKNSMIAAARLRSDHEATQTEKAWEAVGVM